MTNGELGWLVDAESKKAWLYEHLSYFDATNRSGASILAELRARGFEIRTQRFYNVLDAIRSSGVYSDDLRGMSVSELVPLERHLSGHDLSLSWEYVYRGTVLVRNPQTGELAMRTTSVGAHDRLSWSAVTEEVATRWDNTTTKTPEEFVSFTPFSALVDPGVLP